MPRAMKIVIGVLVVAVVIGLISFRGLHRRMQRLAESQTADEKARHEVLAPPISTPTDVTVNAKIFWAAGSDKIAPVAVQLPLSADPVERSRQLLHELTVDPPTPGQRTIPADTALLGFYILPDGTAVADFSDALSFGDAIGNSERGDGGGLDRADARKQRAGPSSPEDSDSRAGSGHTGRQRGLDRVL